MLYNNSKHNDANGIRRLAIAIIRQALRDWQANIPCDACKKATLCQIDIDCDAVKEWRYWRKDARLFFNNEGFKLYASALGYSDKIIAQARKDILYNKKEYFI